MNVMRAFAVAAVVGLVAATPTAPRAQGLPLAKAPEEVGLSGERLKRLSSTMKMGVDKGEIPGAVVLVGRNGKVAYLEAFGFRDREAKAPMKTDAIFRIASMTKPIVSLAIMILAEEGRLSIGHPVSRYLPAFKDLQVGIEKRNSDGSVEVVRQPMLREMTVQDLLRHTSGLTYGAAGRGPLKQAYLDAKLMDPGQTNEQMVAKLATLALVHQPGTVWEYGMSTDVLGRIVEVVGGMPLDRFIAERITKPLKLADTGFAAEAGRQDRAALPQKDPTSGQVPSIPAVTADLTWKSGGGGMVSTAADYARFCQFWLNGGQLDGVRLVSRKTVELMTADHLPPGAKVGADMWPAFQALLPSPDMGQGFGLGFAVRTDVGRNPLHGSVGDYYWGGAYGTYFWIDPKEKLFAILMMQAPAQRLPYRYLMRELVYQAVMN
ncbi:serine hydrolase [Reyranella sp. CPCC 100927]|uniref:serine hydrolase domain-containing protein n=1 Tax=Reyranella sp. CPCC 100927 TaxID=2599616 RepID=UPI0021071A15|nr:serine hydrolase domain-containing protein [Reyranella sp. CPCC 100927]